MGKLFLTFRLLLPTGNSKCCSSLSEVVCISIVLTETAQFSTQHSVSKTKIAIREALHVSKQMYHFHVNILTHSCFTACGSRTPRIVVIVHFRILTYFHLLTARATLQINCTRWYALPVRWRFDCIYMYHVPCVQELFTTTQNKNHENILEKFEWGYPISEGGAANPCIMWNGGAINPGVPNIL